jgi:hypothetical protein
MSKKPLYIVIAIAVLSIAVIAFLLNRNSVNPEKSDAINAITPTTPVFIKVNNPTAFIESFSENQMVQTLMSINGFGNFADKMDTLKSIVLENGDIGRVLKGNDVFLTLNYSGKDDINPMLLIALKTKADSDAAHHFINALKNTYEEQTQTRRYNRVNITEIKLDKIQLVLALNKGILMISNKSIMVEEAIMQQEDDSVELDPELDKLLKTMSRQADFNIFINHKHAERLFNKIAANPLAGRVKTINDYSKWTELDITVSENKLMAGGFTLNDQIGNYFAKTIYKQQPVGSRIDRLLPQSTAWFSSLTLSNPRAFFDHYKDYLTKKNQNLQREEMLLKIEKETGVKIQELFIELMNQEAAIAAISADQSDPRSGRAWVVDTKSGSTTANKMNDLMNNYIVRQKLKKSDWEQEYQFDNQTKFIVYRFPYPNLPRLLFGQLFGGVEASWFAFYNNFIVFGDSFRTVSRILHSNVLGETLSTSMEFNQYKSNFNARGNVTFYVNTNVALPLAGTLFNQKTSAQISGNDELRKFRSFGWQLSSSGDMLYNNVFFMHSPEVKSKPQTVWQSHIEATFDCKPKFVVNHTDPLNKEVVIHDKNNNLILINNIGRVLWQLKLDGPILGEVQQIDHFKNGRLQYLFNTENKLYLIDRNGNNIKNFPVSFRAKATNGVAVFDYDNNKEYRFFVACADRNVYAYGNNGNLLNGWDIFKTDHEVTKPLQHFRVDGRDFVVVSDQMKDYLLHRRGTVRAATTEVYPHSANNIVHFEDRTPANEPRLVTTDNIGNLRYTYFDGRHEVVVLNNSLSENHWLLVEDMNNNKQYEYIFADGKELLIIDSKGKTLLKKQIDHDITHRPSIYTFSRNQKKIGLTCATANKIYLFDTGGALHPGFPLDGCTGFSIGFITSEISNFNLMVGSPEGYLYNYYVE